MRKLSLKSPLFLFSCMMLLASCSGSGSSAQNQGGTSIVTPSYSSFDSSAVITSVSGEYADSFSVVTEDGSFTQEEGTINIVSGGTYVLSGTFEGTVYIDAGEDADVILELNGAKISGSDNSAIYCLSANSLDISAQNGTVNEIIDLREAKETDDESQGGGALYSKVDTTLKGKGTLSITGSYNNGVHVTKDLKIKNLTLYVSAPNNALKGNDSVTVNSGTLTLLTAEGDGIKTENTDQSSKGVQRGTITIAGGTTAIYAFSDGLDAAYDVDVTGGALTIGTNQWRSVLSSSLVKANAYRRGGAPGGTPGGAPGGVPSGPSSSSEKATDSAKGIKADNAIHISGGNITTATYDDGLHANCGTTFESGLTGVGDIEITDGTLSIQASDDGIHADGTLTISGGTILVPYAWEGLEANVLNVSGGASYVYGADDGVNACSGNSSPKINVSGGYMFVCVSPSGDTDGIDSNGTYTQTGGDVITCGPNMGMAAALDTDSTASVYGGSLVVFGSIETNPTKGSGVTSSSVSGTYGGAAYVITFSDGSTLSTGTLSSGNYSNCTAYSVHGSLKSVA